MTTSVQGSFYCKSAFTVRTTVGVSSADFSVSAGTTFATAEAALSSWSAVTSGIGVTFSHSINQATHEAFVVAASSAGSFDVEFSHLGDGSEFRDFLGESSDLTSQADGYEFSGPLASAWFPSYGIRRLDLDAEPWDVQRFMPGSGVITTQNPHSGPGSALRYNGNAVFWYGTLGNYNPHKALRNLLEGIMEYGQPFTIAADNQTYTCRLRTGASFTILPEPVTDLRRGSAYRVSIPVTLEE